MRSLCEQQKTKEGRTDGEGGKRGPRTEPRREREGKGEQQGRYSAVRISAVPIGGHLQLVVGGQAPRALLPDQSHGAPLPLQHRPALQVRGPCLFPLPEAREGQPQGEGEGAQLHFANEPAKGGMELPQRQLRLALPPVRPQAAVFPLATYARAWLCGRSRRCRRGGGGAGGAGGGGGP